MLDGDIENDEYITSAMEAIEKYYNVSILMHFYIHIIINYFIINNNVFIVTDECTASPITTDCAINISQAEWQKKKTSPLPTSVQTGGSSSHPSVLGYTLHPKRVYDTNKFGVKGLDFKMTLKNANTRRYQELVNEFNFVMADIVNEVLGDPDPKWSCEVRNFDRVLNTIHQPRSEVTGVALAELFRKMLQSNQSIDIDNDLTLHVQRVNLPRGKGCNRKLAVNMGLNLLLKRCVFTVARQYDDVPCFGYALALAIVLKDHNTTYVNRRFSIYKQMVLDRVHNIFNIANIPYGPVDLVQYP